jgi:predicted RNA-binding Zn ribbon-like protein
MHPQAALQHRFTLIGEPLAIDLVNTEKLAHTPPSELLADEEANLAFWELQRHRLPAYSAAPGLERVRPLRSAIRSLAESRLAARAGERWAIDVINGYASAAPSNPRLSGDWTTAIEWHSSDADAILGAVARSAIDLFTGPQSARLHTCAADDCSMLFVATNAKRQWCTAAGCGNRQRVARHASRQRATT